MMIRTASTGDIMVLIQFFKDDKTKRELLLDYLAEAFPEISSLQYVINPKVNDTIHDLPVHLFAGRDHIFEMLDGLKYKIGPKSFFQTNTSQAEVLYRIAGEMADLIGDEVVYDLYTGAGTIANYIARRCKQVVGIEFVEDAIADARINAQLNDIENTAFFAGDMKDVLTDSFLHQNGYPDVVITDPPRAGMHASVVQMLLKIAAEKIVYVSCNPATQARDIELLSDMYIVTKIQPVDMFPHTHHVENVVKLELKEVVQK
jgi:23S rRNA (uracil1939-C5)-methyltransferase